MTTHTPEPWILTPCKHANDTAFIIGADGKNVSWVDCEYYNNIRMEDNKRIVACVNACAGISTESLAAEGLHRYGIKLTDRLVALEQQRDELLDALSFIESLEGCEVNEWDAVNRIIPIMAKTAKEAIAKARGKS